MTEQQDPNPFARFFNDTEMVGPILVDDNDDGSVFDAAIVQEFDVAMTALADQMPEGDEEAANALMAQTVQAMMVNCFRAGMLFQHAIDPGSDESDNMAIALEMDEDTATEIVRGLISGHGALLRLVVDRGPN